MPIPKYKRVIYNKPTLDQVVCQLRFPTILRIGAEEPVSFQDGVRKQFPTFEERVPDILSDVPTQIAELISQAARLKGGARAYDFLSENGSWKTKLTNHLI